MLSMLLLCSKLNLERKTVLVELYVQSAVAACLRSADVVLRRPNVWHPLLQTECVQGVAGGLISEHDANTADVPHLRQSHPRLP